MASRREGFPGQTIHRFSDLVLLRLRENPITAQFYVTDIGHYPEARDHRVVRRDGADEAILILCVRGSGTCEYDSWSTAVGPLEAVLLPAHTAHSYGSSADGSWEIYWFHFSGTLTDAVTDRYGKTILRIGATHESDWTSRFRQLLVPIRDGYGHAYPPHLCFKAWDLLGELLYPFYRESIPESPVSRTIDYCRRNLHRPLSLAELCGWAGLSASRLSELFRTETGLSPIDYVIHMKIQRASHLLDNTGESIKGIAMDLGFRDQYYFSRLFRKVVGTPPSVYRDRFIVHHDS